MNFLKKDEIGKVAYTMLLTFILLYGGLARPKLPTFIRKLFNNDIFRVVILTLIAYKSNNNTMTSIVIALFYIITLNLITDEEIKEHFEQTKTKKIY